MSQRIVVVDDEPDIREIISASLQMHGYDVQQAADGVEGQALIRKAKPDLAILDVKMPRMNGFELLMALRKDAATAKQKVLMLTSLTAGSGKRDEMWRESLDVTDFLSKPFGTEELVARVKAILHPTAEKSAEP